MTHKTISFLLFFIGISTITFAQDNKAKIFLDEVSSTMAAYKNIQINFSSVLTNEEAGIKEGDEPPMIGKITLEGEKYNLDFIGNSFIFDGKKLYVINHDEKEISINDGDMDESDGFIYPSKLFTFYKEGYNFKFEKKQTLNGKEIQFVELTPIDSDSEIVKVELGIETKTKHIYQLIQTGANSAKTTITITLLKSNVTLPKNTFVFNKKEYLKKEYSID
jgi:outer membrane lipoprotein-sorting protein